MNLTALRETLDHDGPFASVLMDASHDTEDAAKMAELRWRAIRDELAAQDVPDKTLHALDDAIDRRPPAGRSGRLLVAADGSVLVDEYLPEPPPRRDVRVSALPYLLPLAAWSRRTVPHVVVVVDRVGADLRAVAADGTVRTEDVAGQNHPIRKVRGGGWSHRTVQRRAEETVRRNLGEVADEVAALVRGVDAHLLVLAGDAQARAQLRELLPRHCQRITAEIEHSRRVDPGHDTIDRDITELLAEQRRTEHCRLLERVDAAREHKLAARGLPDTTAALRDGNVEVLLIDTRELADSLVWTGSEPAMVAVDREDLHRVGVSERRHARADEALPAAAIAVGADIVAATGDEPPLELTNGVGALLRHD
ncbi:Vms1/Ankzf1 family peptidyl-tRNA hydrolase [Actinophytocola sp.]|uniref:Rv2629 family ribosome hibernation factor n=1 Tax=Actinophytocola sp. TaxID=1872138 RepID=UPI003D6C6184